MTVAFCESFMWAADCNERSPSDQSIGFVGTIESLNSNDDRALTQLPADYDSYTLILSFTVAFFLSK
jgi:hypothetical protein